MDGEMEGSFSPVMEVWSSSASEEEEEERSTSSLVDEVVEEKTFLNSNNNNNNNNNSDNLCREVTQGEISVRDEVEDKKKEGDMHKRRSVICRVGT